MRDHLDTQSKLIAIQEKEIKRLEGEGKKE